MSADKWINASKYIPCPNCGSDDGICFGPPDSAGGEHYQIDALYCEFCGTIFEVCSWADGVVRFGRLEVVYTQSDPSKERYVSD